MAVDFTGSGQYLQGNNNVTGVDNATTTVSCHFLCDAVGTGTHILNMAASVAAGQSGLAFNTNPAVASGDFSMRILYRWSTTGQWITTTDLSFGVWYSMAVSYDLGATGNDPKVAIGAGNTVNLLTVGSGLTRAATPAGTAKTGIDSIILGGNVSKNRLYNGRIGEVGVWTSLLGDDALQALAAGLSPIHFPNTLNNYWMCRSNTDLTDAIGGIVLAKTGSPANVDHPRVTYPPGPSVDDRAARARIMSSLVAAGGLVGAGGVTGRGGGIAG